MSKPKPWGAVPVVLDFCRAKAKGKPLSVGRRRALYQPLRLAQQNACWLCGEQMGPPGQQPRDATFEHVMPRGRGGSNEPGNLVLAHSACNHKADCRAPTMREIKDAARIGALAQQYFEWRENSKRSGLLQLQPWLSTPERKVG